MPLNPPALDRRFWLNHALPGLLVTLAILAGFELTGLDAYIQNAFYDPSHRLFPFNELPWFKHWFHENAKLPVYAIFAAAILAGIASLFRERWQAARMPLALFIAGLALSAGLISLIKSQAPYHCPYELTQFGGEQPYIRLLQAWPASVPAGHCWPGGHASTGFCLIAGYFALLLAGRRRLALWALGFALIYGHVLGFSQVMRGAHFLSHQMWTMVFCWFINLGLYVAFRRLAADEEEPGREQPDQLAAEAILSQQIDAG